MNSQKTFLFTFVAVGARSISASAKHRGEVLAPVRTTLRDHEAGATGKPNLDVNRAFSEGEWGLARAVAGGLEWSYGWSEPAAQRLRFILDFGYATGLRAGELVGRRLGDLKMDSQGTVWLELVGKGAKTGRVAVPSLARAALVHYLVQRGLSTMPSRRDPNEPLLASLAEDGAAITSVRLRAIPVSTSMVKAVREATALPRLGHIGWGLSRNQCRPEITRQT